MCLPGIKKVNRHSMTKKPMPDKYKIVTIDTPREIMTASCRNCPYWKIYNCYNGLPVTMCPDFKKSIKGFISSFKP